MANLNARQVAADIGVHLNDDQVDYLETLAEKFRGCADWRMWMKNRLTNMGLLRARRKGCDEVALYTVLHIFNIHRADVLPSTGQFLFSPEVARSKVIRGVVVPRPIDRVAWRLTPQAEQKAIAAIREIFALD